MKAENTVWVIMWRYSDGSDSGIVSNMAYEDWNAAQHIRDTLVAEGAPKVYKVVELGIVRGELL
jgi:hypothetical protein